jgi:hypothetical protein
MKIETKAEPDARIKLVKGSAFQTETAPHLPRLPTMTIACGKRGSGKSVAITNLLRMYKETKTMDRIFIISPTFNSNKKLMKELDVKEEDVFIDPDEPGLVQKIVALVDSERNEYLRWQHLKNNYDRIMKQIKMGMLPPTDEFDDYLMSYFDIANNTFNLPPPKYDCYHKGQPPVLALFIDDSLCSKLMTNRKFPALIMRHRHLGDFPQGGAVGLSIFIAIQSYKATSGLPKCIRNQSTSICLFRSKDVSEKKQIADSFSGEIPVELFLKLYDVATEKPRDFLFVDLHKKPEQPNMFRRCFDTYLIVATTGESDTSQNNDTICQNSEETESTKTKANQ